MGKYSFNPVNSFISLVVGWFFMAFLQAAVRSLAAGDWKGLVPRFQATALLHDGKSAAINLAAIVVIGIVGTGIWLLARRS